MNAEIVEAESEEKPFIFTNPTDDNRDRVCRVRLSLALIAQHFFGERAKIRAIIPIDHEDILAGSATMLVESPELEKRKPGEILPEKSAFFLAAHTGPEFAGFFDDYEQFVNRKGK